MRSRTLTIDVDGTVLCAGKHVDGARRGYNPHHRKVPSYYPITAYLADSGHFLGVHNRPDNVNDGSASIPFLKDVFTQVEETLGDAYTLRLVNFEIDTGLTQRNRTLKSTNRPACSRQVGPQIHTQTPVRTHQPRRLLHPTKRTTHPATPTQQADRKTIPRNCNALQKAA